MKKLNKERNKEGRKEKKGKKVERKEQKEGRNLPIEQEHLKMEKVKYVLKLFE